MGPKLKKCSWAYKFPRKVDENLREEFDAEIQESRIDIQAAKAVVKDTRLEFKTQVSQVEARAEQGCRGSAGTGETGVRWVGILSGVPQPVRGRGEVL